MSNFIRSAALTALALMGFSSLSACSTMPGNTNGLGTDGMSMVIVHKNPYAGKMTSSDYHVAVVLVKSCLDDVRRQQSGLIETMATNGGLDTAAGYAGGSSGESAEAAMLGAHLVKGAVPAVGVATAAVTGAQGVFNGIKIKSSAVTGIVGTCANGDLHDPVTANMAPNMHIYGSVIRTKNRSKELPSWIKKTNDPFEGSGDTTDPQSH